VIGFPHTEFTSYVHFQSITQVDLSWNQINKAMENELRNLMKSHKNGAFLRVHVDDQ